MTGLGDKPGSVNALAPKAHSSKLRRAFQFESAILRGFRFHFIKEDRISFHPQYYSSWKLLPWNVLLWTVCGIRFPSVTRRQATQGREENIRNRRFRKGSCGQHSSSSEMANLLRSCLPQRCLSFNYLPTVGAAVEDQREQRIAALSSAVPLSAHWWSH